MITNKTTNRIWAALTALLLAVAPATASHPHRGIGCWRGTPRRTAPMTMARMLSRQFQGDAPSSPYIGQKRGLVILAEFPETTFKSGHDADKYLKILNEPGYTTSEGFRGSAADYFRDQSGGQFELNFDVVGPYKAAHQEAYYGVNDDLGLDLRPELLIKEMCEAADSEVDFSNYDWDGDGEVDEVFVVYAGKSEINNYDRDADKLIWPHMWSMEESTTGVFELDGMRINIYACSNELKSTGAIDGIGTFCHEFSHCLGLPDLYDTIDSGEEGMSNFDIMDQGCYSGRSFCPVGYSAYEKMACGWQMPIVLGNEDVTVDSIQPISLGGDTYIIYNDAQPDEYYMIENRKRYGWDTNYPVTGLLITHIDYDKEVWENNLVNSVISLEDALEMEYTCGNDHSRVTFFNASNNKRAPQLYPFSMRDSLTATSKPAATLWNTNSQGTKLMLGAIVDIKQHNDGTMAFTYRAPATATAITTVSATDKRHQRPTYYTTDGRAAGTDWQSLRHGVYIVNGRKVVR